MNKAKVAAAFNRWMDEYTNNPEKFEHTSAAVLRHQREKDNGETPSYGSHCAAMLDHYMAEEEGA
ncbi:hypothetical protein ACJO2E_02495 [Marinobacter sp. M1N3S26]|uniref:hypothetical protein n=1 Tax=Marinobacter sp. M1N3S26 TaxID=3382299 RepID=UPI00387A867B